jgi:hypothetical protein
MIAETLGGIESVRNAIRGDEKVCTVFWRHDVTAGISEWLWRLGVRIPVRSAVTTAT